MASAKLTIVVRMFLQADGKVMLLKQTNKNGGNHTMVGGKIDRNEMAVTALIRETHEEAGIVIKEKNLKLVHVLNRARKSSNELILVFRAKKWKGDPEPKETRKFKAVTWCDPLELPKDTIPIVRHIIKNYLKGRFYSEYFDPEISVSKH